MRPRSPVRPAPRGRPSDALADLLAALAPPAYAGGVSALTDDELDPRPVAEWHLPTDLPGFLAILRQTPSFGTTDHERVDAFMRGPAAKLMPETLKDDLRRGGFLD